jgi:type I restriction enzyme S subunit
LAWTNINNLKGSELEKLKFAIPNSTKEQQKISEILKTSDTQIDIIKNIIKKLELRNKGLGQQLLTWKKRLEWFNWSFDKLFSGDIFKSISIKNNEWEELLSATQDKWIVLRSSLDWRVTMPTTWVLWYKLVVPWNFVISLRSFQWGLEYSTYKWLVSPAYTILEPKIDIDDEYFKYYFKSYDFIWHLAIAVVWIRDWKNISYSDFCTIKIPYPELSEQTAIANVLNKATEQFNLYKDKLEKLESEKKGLMQQLLTGKVRVKI